MAPSSVGKRFEAAVFETQFAGFGGMGADALGSRIPTQSGCLDPPGNENFSSTTLRDSVSFRRSLVRRAPASAGDNPLGSTTVVEFAQPKDRIPPRRIRLPCAIAHLASEARLVAAMSPSSTVRTRPLQQTPAEIIPRLHMLIINVL